MKSPSFCGTFDIVYKNITTAKMSHISKSLIVRSFLKSLYNINYERENSLKNNKCLYVLVTSNFDV